jgi:hypothetical protein
MPALQTHCRIGGVVTDPIKENGHEFVTGESVGFNSESILSSLYVCLQCGIVRRKDGQNRWCKGKVRVELRGEE